MVIAAWAAVNATPTSALDPSFGPPATPGIVRVAPAVVYRDRQSIAAFTDGSLVVAVGRDVRKLTSSGDVDPLFDASNQVPSCASTFDVGVDPSARVVVVANGGCAPIGGGEVVVARLGPTGTRDATFDGSLPTTLAQVRLVSTDGAVVLAGVGAQGACLYRFRDSDGVLDPTFGPAATPGRFCLAVNPGDARARAVVRPGGGFTFVASSAQGGATLAQLASNGMLQGTTHPLPLASSFASVSDIAALPADGLLVVGIDNADNRGPFVQRVDATGALVPSFNAAGQQPGRMYVTSDALEWTVTPFGDGRFVLGGARGGFPRAIMIDADGNADRALESTGPVPGAMTVVPAAPAQFGKFTDLAVHAGRVAAIGAEGSGSQFEQSFHAAVIARSDLVGPPQIADTALFRPTEPTRILDTRPGAEQTGYTGTKPAAGATVELQIGGRAGMPATGIGAVALNVTATDATAPGFVSVWPSGGPLPLVSSLNVERVGQTIPNLVIVPVGTNGRVSIYTLSGTHLLADVLGWFPAGGALRTIAPTRVLDTRPGPGQVGYIGPKPTDSSTLTLQIAGRAGLPQSGVGVALMNLTATESDQPGFITAWPAGTVRPVSSSNLNIAAADQTIANFVMVPVSADGAINLFTLGDTHLIADLVGWLPPNSGFVPPPPDRSSRILDTRGFGDRELPPMAGGTTVTAGSPGIQIVNVVAVNAAGPGFLTIYPAGTERPRASNVNVERAGQTIANAAIIRGSASGFTVFTLSSAHVLVDSFGTFPEPDG